MLLVPNKGSSQGHDKSIQTITLLVYVYIKINSLWTESEYFGFCKNILVPNTYSILMGVIA